MEIAQKVEVRVSNIKARAGKQTEKQPVFDGKIVSL